MAKRYENRYGRGGHRRDREYADDRGYMDRASDEVRSWFGDHDADRRRRMDEQRDRDREHRSGAERYRDHRSRGDWNPETNRRDWNRNDWTRDDRSRSDEWRPSNANRGWQTQPENWRGDYRPNTGRYEYGRSWTGADWDRDRPMHARDRDSHERDRSWSTADRDREWTTPDRDREWSSQQRQPPARRYSGSAWSTDEGRMEFGGASAGATEGSAQARWGRGPKGYHRPDSRIYEDVCDRLTYSNIDAENIEVSVNNGQVTLSGTVRDRWDKRRAEDVAEDIPGVRDVTNSIRVERPERGIGQSESSASDQPGTVLGVSPTAEANITDAPTTRPVRRT